MHANRRTVEGLDAGWGLPSDLSLLTVWARLRDLNRLSLSVSTREVPSTPGQTGFVLNPRKQRAGYLLFVANIRAEFYH